MYKLVDSHCHINDKLYDENRSEVIEKIRNEMEFVVCSGWDFESSLSAVKLANEHKNIYASIGYHPTDVSKITDKNLEKIYSLLKNNDKVVGIGEIGLDYYWAKDNKDIQKKYLHMQLEMIKDLKKAAVIHTREALFDTLSILDGYKDIGGVLHCYPGSYEAVRPLLDRYYVSVGGVVTFKNAKKTKEMVSKVPIERIVLETDSPYLTPTPFRGKINYPTYTEYVAKEIAIIKNMTYDDVVNITSENAYKVYNICK